MSAENWERDLAGLADTLSQGGAIDPARAEVLKRLVSEVGALARGRTGKRPREVVVRTAVPLTPEERTGFEQALARRFAGHLVVFEVDPGILGGVWLRVGDQIIDGSLRGKLEALRKQIGREA
jgi:F-type H+-transporting ATPase subunit delta